MTALLFLLFLVVTVGLGEFVRYQLLRLHVPEQLGATQPTGRVS